MTEIEVGAKYTDAMDFSLGPAKQDRWTSPQMMTKSDRLSKKHSSTKMISTDRCVCVCVCVHACMRVRVCAHAHASAYVCVLCVHTCKCIVKLGQDMMNSLVCFLKRNLKTMNRSTKSNTYLHHTALNSRR